MDIIFGIAYHWAVVVERSHKLRRLFLNQKTDLPLRGYPVEEVLHPIRQENANQFRYETD